MPSDRPVLADVAKVAGVSPMTVSNVLNDRPGASQETRRRVRLAAEKLGYTPNPAARSLAKRRTNLIGLITHDLTVQYATELTRGISDALAETGHELLISATYQDASREGSRIQQLAGGTVDALILIAPVLGNETVDALDNSPIPVVVLDPRRPGAIDHPYIHVDNYSGMRSGTEHLLRLGHRRIGFVGGDSSFDSSAERERGHRDAVSLSNADLDPRLVASADFSWFGGFEAAHRLLELDERPTAVVAACDMAALGAIAAAQSCGLSVPQDLSVVGFDDIPLATQAFPKLTTVSQPLFEMGKSAARTAASLVRGLELPTSEVRFATELVIRDSTAMPTGLTADPSRRGQPGTAGNR